MTKHTTDPAPKAKDNSGPDKPNTVRFKVDYLDKDGKAIETRLIVVEKPVTAEDWKQCGLQMGDFPSGTVQTNFTLVHPVPVVDEPKPT